MSDIAPIGTPQVASATRAGRTNPATTPSSDPTASRSGDSVELSSTAQLLSRLIKQPAIRQDLVNTVKGQIANNTYETPDKLDTAIDSLAQDLQG